MTRGRFDPQGVFSTLARHDVDYVVIGGMAVIAHGIIRATEDVDVVADPESKNLERLAAALEDLRAQITGVDLLGIDLSAGTLASGANFTLETRCGPLDLMQDAAGAPSYEELTGSAVAVEVGGVDFQVCSRGHLEEMMRAMGRARDIADLDDLAALDS